MLALLGVTCLASVPPLVAEHLRQTSRHALGAVVNGVVVEVTPSGRGFTATVEYLPEARQAPVRIKTDARRVGLLWPRSSLQVGDPVLVDFDPARPSEGRVFSIAPLWWPVARRLAAGALLLLVAVAMLFLQGRKVG